MSKLVAEEIASLEKQLIKDRARIPSTTFAEGDLE